MSNYKGEAPASLDVLDHGFVALRNIAGPTRRTADFIVGDSGCGYERTFDASDVDPAQAARMSFGNMNSERTEAEDFRLSNYLMKNWHNSPFEMVTIWLEMKLPIFIARQFVRHRTVSINEISGRYVQLDPHWYIPSVVGSKPTDAKQGQGTGLSDLMQASFKNDLNNACKDSYHAYEMYLANGVAAEHARMFLHLNHYTHWLWKQDLHNIMNFLRLRDHFHAQIEAQLYAQAISTMLRQYLPYSMELFDKHRRMTEPTVLGYKLTSPNGEKELSFVDLTTADKKNGWSSTPLTSRD